MLGFRASLLRCLCPAPRYKCCDNDCRVQIHVGDGRDADAWRLDDVDDVDADARTDAAKRYGFVPNWAGVNREPRALF
jgi:hypothetical protein